MNTRVRRDVVQSPMPHGSRESVVYRLTTTPWGSNPTNPSLSVIQLSTGEDVTDEVVAAGSIAIAGDVLTLPAIENLVPGRRYQVRVTFDTNGSGLEALAILVCDN